MIEEMSKWNEKGKESFVIQYNTPEIVLLDSAYCSMGRMIARKACAEAGFRYFDAAELLKLIPDSELSIEEIDAFEKKLYDENIDIEGIQKEREFNKINDAFNKASDRAIASGRCLIHERACTHKIKAANSHVLTVFTFTDKKAFILERATVNPVYAELKSEKDIMNAVITENNIRRNWKKLRGDSAWGDISSYDISMNTDMLGRDYSSVILADLMIGK